MSKEKLKHDIVFLSVIILVAFLIWTGYRLANQGSGRMVIVIQDGEVVGIYPLSEEKIAIISYEENEYNLLQISGGSAYMLEADCPDQICVNHTPVSRNGESIICLPHKLVVQISSEADASEKGGGMDALTY